MCTVGRVGNEVIGIVGGTVVVVCLVAGRRRDNTSVAAWSKFMRVS